MNSKALIALAIGDMLLVIAIVILAFRWGRLGIVEVTALAVLGALTAYFFTRGIRLLFAARKPPEDEQWKSIEP